MKKIFLIILLSIFWLIFLYFYHTPKPFSCIFKSEILENDKYGNNFIKKCYKSLYYHNISRVGFYSESYLKYDLDLKNFELLGNFIIKDKQKIYKYNQIIENPENANIEKLKKYIFTKDIELFKDDKNVYLLLKSTMRFKKIGGENGEIIKINDYLFKDEKYLYDSAGKIENSDTKTLIFENGIYKDKNFSYGNEKGSFKK